MILWLSLTIMFVMGLLCAPIGMYLWLAIFAGIETANSYASHALAKLQSAIEARLDK